MNKLKTSGKKHFQDICLNQWCPKLGPLAKFSPQEQST